MYFGDQIIEGLESPHPMYSEQEESWQIMQDCFDGEMAIKAKGVTYLPTLYGQGAYSYTMYKDRAYFYGATTRVTRGSVGMLLANPPSLHADERMAGDEAMQDFYDSLASDNSSFQELLRRICMEFVLKGRVGLFVDGEREGDVFRPKIIRYRAEDIINWDYDRMAEGLPWKLRYVVLREDRFMPKENVPWDRERSTQWRVLWIDPETGFYNQAAYVKLKTGKEGDEFPFAIDYTPQGEDKTVKYMLIPGSHIVPTKGGAPMTEIPFWVLNYAGDSGSFEQPPLLELALMNLSHYRTTAQIENARSYAGAPTVVFSNTGNQVGLGNVQLGTGKAINLEEDANVDFLEMSGSALASLEKAMDEKELKMALLGGRILSPEPEKGQEATATHKLRRKGEMSVIASMADTISFKMTSLVRFAAEWGMKGDPMQYRVLLVKEFSTLAPDSTLLITLSKLVSMKLISFENWFDVLAKMELLPTGTDINKELEKIENGKGSDIIAGLIALEHAPKVEEIDVQRANGNSNGNGEKPR